MRWLLETAPNENSDNLGLLRACVISARDPSDNDTDVPNRLQRFPWFAFVVQFAATRQQSDVEVDNLTCSAELLRAVPVGVRALTFGQLIHNLAMRIEPPPTFGAATKHARATTLLAAIRSRFVDIESNAVTTPMADECIALTVRAYDEVANELRWLVVPRVVRRQFGCTKLAANVHFGDRDQSSESDCLCEARWPSLVAALIGACAPDEMTESAQDRATLTCARLVVLLFDCVEHYLRVGGAQFVRRAAAALLLGNQGDESVLHLFADVLRASIALVRGFGEQSVLLRPTTTLTAERIVVFRRRQAAVEDESWCIGEVNNATGRVEGLDDDVRTIDDWSANKQCRMQIFNALRAGQLDVQELLLTSMSSSSSSTTSTTSMAIQEFFESDSIDVNVE